MRSSSVSPFYGDAHRVQAAAVASGGTAAMLCAALPGVERRTRQRGALAGLVVGSALGALAGAQAESVAGMLIPASTRCDLFHHLSSLGRHHHT